jgi:hypothetical protein
MRARPIVNATSVRVSITAPAAASEVDPADDPDGADAGYEPRELVQKRENPLSDVATLALVNGFEFGAAPEDDAFRYGATREPVVPWLVTDDRALIHRAVLPCFQGMSIMRGWRLRIAT